MEVLVYDTTAGAFSANNQLMVDRYEAETYEADRDEHVLQDELFKNTRYAQCANTLIKYMKDQRAPLFNHMSDETLKGCFTTMYGDYFVHPEQIKVLRSMLPYTADFWETN